MRRAVIFDWNGTLFNERTGQLYPMAKLIVRRAQAKYKMGLVSMGDFETRKRLLERTGLLQYFTSVIIGPEKTAKQFAECIEELSVRPEETLVVDDYVIRGIKAGNTLGCETCWVTQSRHASVEPDEDTGQPTYTIGKIADLREML